jgi:hypothetical protein
VKWELCQMDGMGWEVRAFIQAARKERGTRKRRSKQAHSGPNPPTPPSRLIFGTRLAIVSIALCAHSRPSGVFSANKDFQGRFNRRKWMPPRRWKKARTQRPGTVLATRLVNLTNGQAVSVSTPGTRSRPACSLTGIR